MSGNPQPPARRIRPFNLAAFICVTAGLVVALLAWRGASATPLVFEQVPYAISGGLLSVALLALGGMLAVADLVTRLSDQRRTRDRRLRAGVENLRTRLLGR